MTTISDKQFELYKNWCELVALKQNMGGKILELCAHPEATPEHLAQVMPCYSRTVEMLKKHKPVVIKAMEKAGKRVLADKIRLTPV